MSGGVGVISRGSPVSNPGGVAGAKTPSEFAGCAVGSGVAGGDPSGVPGVGIEGTGPAVTVVAGSGDAGAGPIGVKGDGRSSSSIPST